MMRHWRAAVWLLVPSVVMTASLVSGRAAVLSSFVWSMDLVASTCIIVWPIGAGICCADTVRLVRSRSLIDTFPSAGRLKAALVLPLTHGLWITAGTGVSAAWVGALSLGHGSVISLHAFLPPLLAGIGSFAFTALGSGIAFVAVSFVTAPLVAIGLYLAMAFDIGHAEDLVAFAGATSSGVLFTVYDLTGLAVLVVCWAAIALMGISLLMRGLTMSLGSAVAGVVSLIGILVLLSAQAAVPLYAPADSSSWGCRTTGHTTVCLPPDQISRAESLSVDLDLRLRSLAVLDSSVLPATVDFSRGSWEYPDPSAGAEELTSIAVIGISTCMAQDADALDGLRDTHALSDEDRQAAFEDAEAVSRWLDERLGMASAPPNEAPTDAVARTALLRLRSCATS